MNREIKFRAWDKENKTMIDMHAMEYFAHTETRNQVRFDLMQYTGLHDKNGKEIYEGDIFNDKSRVVWGFCAWGREHKDNTAAPSFSQIADYEGRIKLEVIGNIYENPELLKKENLCFIRIISTKY